MPIDIHIDTTPRQDNKLATYLARTNEIRVRSGQPPYPTINDLLKDLLIQSAKGLVQSPDIEDAKKVADAYIDAGDAIQNQIKTLLGVT